MATNTTKISRRDFLKTATVAVGAGLLAACGSKATATTKPAEQQPINQQPTPQPASPVKLSLWHGDWNVWNPYFDGIAARALYAGITPKVLLDTPPMPWNEYNDKLQMAGEAGVGPDILFMIYTNYTRFINAKSISEVPESVYPYAELEKDYWDVVMQPLKIVDGKYHYVPFEVHGPGASYNVNMIKEAGFDNPPTSWDEFLAQAQACVKKDNGQVIQSGITGDFPYMWWKDVVESIGGRYMRPEDKDISTLDNDSTWEAMQLLVDYQLKYDIYHPDFNIAIGGAVFSGYLWGKTAFSWWYNGQNTTLEQQVKGGKGGGIHSKLLIPKLGPNGFKQGTRPNWGLAVTSATPAEKLDAAWKIWKFTLSHDERLLYTKSTYLPNARVSVMDLGKDAYAVGPRQEEAGVELEINKCCSFVWGQPINDAEYFATVQDIYNDMASGTNGKEAFKKQWTRLENAYLGKT